METIKFSRKSFGYQYWSFVTNINDLSDEPKDTCNMRKQMIVFTFFALISLPLFIALKVAQRISDFCAENFIGKSTMLLATSLNVLVLLVSILFYSEKHLGLISSYLASLASIIFIITFLVFIVITANKIINYFEKRNLTKSMSKREPSLFKVLYNSAKEKLCSKIEFID